ncbi:MAG: MmcQ/YjbR family DNA-binding protein [Erysipelotrichaceae bacterium]|nr:MmcQ/YjbR family DNA-binding protein [Erysipelotrichaceae bacterium]
MSLETDLFSHLRPSEQDMTAYGFRKTDHGHVYEHEFMDGRFRAVITVRSDGNVSGKVMDTELDEEYIQVHVPGAIGSFAAAVKEEYIAILEDIARHCFYSVPFVSDQANRLSEQIFELWHDRPEYTFQDKNYVVFRHQENEKWYALFMRIDADKILAGASGQIDIVNLKTPDDRISSLHSVNGIYPAWHMNRKHWITVILDDTLSDAEIMKLLETSHDLTAGRKTESVRGVWLVPANPSYYDVPAAFRREHGMISWKQSTDVHVGDIVYMYMGSPYSAIIYRTECIETDIPYYFENDQVKMRKLMRLKLLHEYRPDEFPFSLLKEYGVRAVRGPRSVPPELLKLLEAHAD